MKLKEQIRLDNSYTIYTKKCKCGHSIVFNPSCPVDKILCDHCGHYIFRNDDAKKQYDKQVFMNTLKRHLF